MSLRSLFLSLAALAAVQAADDPWHYLDPGSKMVMGIQWRRIADSPLGQKLRQDMHDNLPIPALPGTGFLNNVDHVLLSSTGIASTKPNAQPPVLIVVTGQFDLAKVRAAVNKKSRRAVVQNVEIFESPDKNGGHMGIALVSSETLLVGDFAAVVKAVGAPTGHDNLLMARSRQMSDHNELWMVSTASPAEVAGPNVPMPLPLPMDEVCGMELGLSVTDGMEMDLSLQMTSSDAAQKLRTDMLKTLKLAGKEKSSPEMANLDKYLKVTAEHEYLMMNLNMDAATVDQRMRAWQAKRKASAAAVVSAASQPPPRPAITKPVIWNADPQE